MPAVRLAFRASRRGRAGMSRPSHPKVAIYGEKSGRLELPLAPRLDHDGLARRWETLERVGRKPLLASPGPDLRSYSARITLVGRDARGRLDPSRSVEPALQALRGLARTGERVRWERYGPSEGGWFRITDLSVSDEQRAQGTNAITLAEVSVTLTEASDAVVNIGPITGGAKPPAPAKPKARTYTVVKGDTLWAIAVRYYGDGTRWPKIADANGVRDPRKLQIGHKLRIP